jgi:hypothetical protein
MGGRLARALTGGAPAQRRPMRMWPGEDALADRIPPNEFALPATRISPAGLVLVDLPVDVVVVLKQQERAGQGERIARPPC